MPHLTPTREFSAEIEAKGSRFIAHLVPIVQWEGALDRLAAEHRKASHIVTATRILGEGDTILDRARDDGEPGGTAGMPALKVLIGANIVEAGVAIVRYFGGTKLGTGGLARAYGGAASAAVETAPLVPWQKIVTRTLRATFSEAGKLETLVAALPLVVVDRTHTEDGLILTVKGPETEMASLAP